MNNTRTGKIARLPKALRDALNRRLANGEPGKRLLEWLNALPEVQTVLNAEFAGRAINGQNLTDWKRGGYHDWVVQQEALELAQRLAEEAVELQAGGRPPLTDTLALWLAARYAVATRQVRETEGAEGWRRLRELCGDIVELRRGDHSAERLRLEREALEVQRQQSQDKLKKLFWEWARQPENKNQICGPILTPEQRARRIREIYGRGSAEPHAEPEASDNPPILSNQGKSSLIKPNESACA